MNRENNFNAWKQILNFKDYSGSINLTFWEIEIYFKGEQFSV